MVTYETKSKPDRQGLWSSRRSPEDEWEEVPVFRQATGTDETLFTIIDGFLYNTNHLDSSGREWVGPMVRPAGFPKRIAIMLTVL